MELVFAFLAGLLTLINPCVLPVLPIVLGAALQAHRHAALALAAGMSVSFVTLGMFVATLGRSLGITENVLSQTGAILMILFGLVLLVPAFNQRFATATAGFSERADTQLNQQNTNNLKGQFLGGLLLGAVWSPCIGPTLGGAISLASQGEQLTWAFAIMVSFALGVSSIILALAYGTREAIQRRQQQLRHIAEYAKPIMGAVFITVGLLIFFKVHHLIDMWFIEIMPIWLQDLSVKF